MKKIDIIIEVLNWAAQEPADPIKLRELLALRQQVSKEQQSTVDKEILVTVDIYQEDILLSKILSDLGVGK